MFLGVSRCFARLGHLHGNGLFYLVLIICRMLILKAVRVFPYYQTQESLLLLLLLSGSPGDGGGGNLKGNFSTDMKI